MTRRSGALIEGEHVSHAGNKRLKKAMFLPAFALLRSAPSPGPITGTNATRASAAPSRHRPDSPPRPQPARHDPKRRPLRFTPPIDCPPPFDTQHRSLRSSTDMSGKSSCRPRRAQPRANSRTTNKVTEQQILHRPGRLAWCA
ncbi:hypothetical protein QU670_09335 [Actinomyces massiliensis]|uniref:hypothetical protein n=1 Tax=Actinomyces massiliensis TaxID=461393 RepID=UPI001E4E3A10|nr:hypothetical protein [Actinomyces massiliensis]WLD73133.1 hypothetical protein QU670_09335 [Actinomyces massiliensis]